MQTQGDRQLELTTFAERTDSAPMTLVEPRPDASARPAIVLCMVMVGIALALLPTAAVPLAPVRRFVFFQGGSLLTAYAITACLMLHQYHYRRSGSVLLLIAAYCWSAALQVPMLLTYPGPSDGAGIPLGEAGSTAWEWHAWHCGFGLLALAYAVVEWRFAGWTLRRGPFAALAAIGATLVVAGGLAIGAITAIDQLPTMVHPSGQLGTANTVFSVSTLAIVAAAFGLLWMRDGRYKPMNLWLAVSLTAAFGDELVAVMSGVRYALGWYCSRVYGLVAASVLLMLFLREFGLLHRRLQAAHAAAQSDNATLEERVRARTAELKAALHDAEDAHEQLRQVEKVRVVGQLAAGVAHDFNNILQVIGGVMEVVKEELQPGGEALPYVDAAAKATERGGRLTQQLLAYARKQMLAPTLLELPALLADVQAILARTLGSRITVDLDLDPTLSPVLADSAQLQTALINLGINAAHAMPNGGTLRFDAHWGAPSDFGELSGGDYIVIATIDTGTGMAPDVVARAFEPFFTTKGLEGTGLGLAMVQGFSRQTGGDARIISAPGQGTRVEMWLPAVRRQIVARGPAPATNENRPKGAGRVLLVDDSSDVLLTVRAFLTKSGYTVRHAASGDDALATLATGERFDILITDYMMPGLLGSDLIEQARVIQPGLAVLIITGFSAVTGLDPDQQEAALLRKPFKRDELIERVNALLTERDATASGRRVSGSRT